jgi:two-component system, LytTR family, sensor kinase
MALLPRSPRVRTVAAWLAAAVVVPTVLSLRSTIARYLTVGLVPDFFLTGLRERVIWTLLYYAMWLALTPLIFASARRYPFRRDRWAGPLVVHTVAACMTAGVGLALLSALFGGLARGDGWVRMADLASPAWVHLAMTHAAVDSMIYGLILAAGHGVMLYDQYQARLRTAADLQRSLVEAQVDALRMKLQPHFLFNTLNSISFLAVEHDVAGIQTMVERLGRLLRASMTVTGHQMVSLAEELELLDEYLGIEEVRFRDRLRVTREVTHAAMEARVPSLVLQPIVENSIKHGFSKRIDASCLDITIDRNGDMLEVTVTDDGPGLPAGWDLTTHCGRGLRNVIERLDALYQGRWSFTLRNARRGGTVAELRFPVAG